MGTQQYWLPLAMDGLPLYSWEGQVPPVLAGVGMFEETSIALPLSADKLATLADSLWAMPGGNESANGTAVEQVQTNQPQGSDEQLPLLGANLNTNYNSIGTLTSISPAQIFSHIQTFAGAQPLK